MHFEGVLPPANATSSKGPGQGSIDFGIMLLPPKANFGQLSLQE